MRPTLLLFACSFAGLAMAACGGAQKNNDPFKQKVEIIKKPNGTELPEPISADINPGQGAEAPPREPIYFDFDAYTVRDDSRPVLQKVADYLNKNTGAIVTISGHTDDRGTTEYNLALGDQRAKAARDYLVRLGVDAARIKIISFGEERPAEPGSGEAAWSRNRRAEFDTSSTR